MSIQDKLIIELESEIEGLTKESNYHKALIFSMTKSAAEDKKTITELKRKLELSECSYNLLLNSEIIKI